MRCFSSPGALPTSGRVIVSQRWGCPIRRSSDQRLLATPPRLSQLCHVLHRHAAPRHPPSAHTVFPAGRLDVDRSRSLIQASLIVFTMPHRTCLTTALWKCEIGNADHTTFQHTLHLV